MNSLLPVAHLLMAVIWAPLLVSLIQHVRSRLAGRAPPNWLQFYSDLVQQLQTIANDDPRSTWIIRTAPTISLAAILTALVLVPFGGQRPLVHFDGDFVLLIGLFAVARLSMNLAAMDTGSDASERETGKALLISVLAEPALLLSFAALAEVTGQLSMTDVELPRGHMTWSIGVLTMLPIGSLLIALAVAVTQMPLTDEQPSMVSQNEGSLRFESVDIAFVRYAHCLIIWMLTSLIVEQLLPATKWSAVAEAIGAAAMILVAVIAGIISHFLAHRFHRIIAILIGAILLPAVALLVDCMVGTVL